MILLTDFLNGNITDVILGAGITVLGWALNRIIKDNDIKIKEIVQGNKDEIDRMNKHIENTDKELIKVKEDHNDLKLDVIKNMNEIEKSIIGKINDLSLKIEQQWRNKS